jgi:hypothetical protein
MIQKAIKLILKEDIESLINSKVSEGRTLEYKQQLPEGDTESKREFLYDVSSFANAAGGDLVFGITDERDANGKPTGLPCSADGLKIPNISEAVARLENLTRDGVTPRIQGIQWQPIEGFPSGPMLVMRIPKSMIGPHMVIFGGMARFYSRNSTGKYPMEYGEIRSAFVESTDIEEKLRAFRNARVVAISNGDSPAGIVNNPVVIVHLMPLSVFTTSDRRDLTRIAAQHESSLQPFNAGGWGGRYNFDGYVSSSGKEPKYVQVFRNGSMEAADATLLVIGQKDYENQIPTIPLEKTVIAAVRRYLDIQRGMEVPLPIFVSVTLFRVKGFTVSYFGGSTIDRNVLMLPEVLVEDYDSPAHTLLRPAFDTLWQACGHEKSLHYDTEGNWRPHG